MSTAVIGSRIRLASGLVLHCVEQGPPDGTPVLLLHGYTDSWFSYSRVLPLLPRQVRAIVPDHRGHGESDSPAGSWSMADFARDLVELLDAMEVERVTVAGHSMGGLIALHLAIAAPQRVSGLIIVSSGISVRYPAAFDLATQVARLTEPIDLGFVRDFQRSTIHQPVPSEFFTRVVMDSGRVPVHVWQSVMHAMLQEDYSERAALVRCPVRVLWGDRDAVFPRESQDALLRAMPHAEFAILPEVGHALHWEAPTALVAAIGALANVRPELREGSRQKPFEDR